ncbi:gag-pol polyprotein [Tanacetum coccineum]
MTEKAVLTLVHMARSLRKIFQKHKVKVVTDGPMEEMLKISNTKGRLAKWVVELRTHYISYIQRKEAEGQVVKKFIRQGEQVLGVSNKNNERASRSKEKPQEELVPAPRAWRLYMGKEPIKEGSGVGMILVILEEKVYSYAICLNVYTSKDSMDYEALLAGLVASADRGMKDLHVFVGSKLLVDQVEGSRVPRNKEVHEEILDATASFHMFQITHLPKALNPKAEALTGLASIRLEFLNREVLVGIKTRP